MYAHFRVALVIRRKSSVDASFWHQLPMCCIVSDGASLLVNLKSQSRCRRRDRSSDHRELFLRRLQWRSPAARPSVHYCEICAIFWMAQHQGKLELRLSSSLINAAVPTHSGRAVAPFLGHGSDRFVDMSSLALGSFSESTF